MVSNDSKVEKIQKHFLALSDIASTLNAASDELTKEVGILDEALKKLNVGLTVWVSFRHRGNDEEPSRYDEDQIGYAKVNGRWGIALRRIWGDESIDVHGEEGPWPFNDGPREMRIHGVDKVSDLIEELGKEAFRTVRKIHEKTKEVRDLGAAIGSIKTGEKRPTSAERAAETPKSQTRAITGVRDLLASSANEKVK